MSKTLLYKLFSAGRIPKSVIRQIREEVVVLKAEVAGTIIVNHEIRVQPTFLAPGWLIRRSLLQDLPDMLACIRGLAVASSDQQAQLADLQRCPGDADQISEY